MNPDNNPYAPPAASLVDEPEGVGDGGSVEAALRGDYHVDPGTVIRQAWALVNGAKLPFFLAAFLGGVIIGGLNILTDTMGLTALALGLDGFVEIYAFGQLRGILMLPITAPFFAGIGMMGAHRAAGHEVSVASLFAWYRFTPQLAALGVLVTLVTTLGYALLVIPGVYLLLGLMFAHLLVVDKGMPVIEAMQTSVKAVHHQWGNVFATSFGFGAIMGASMLLLLIPLFWTMPMMFIGTGVLYRTIFGVSTPPA